MAQFANDISDLASRIGQVDTSKITGTFGETLRDQQQSFVSTLESFSENLHDLQAVADEHKRSEEVFVSNAPTLAEIAQAEKELFDLQAGGPTKTGRSAIADSMGLIDINYMAEVEKAQQRVTQLSQERRDAVRVFLDEQTRLHDRINGIQLPRMELPTVESWSDKRELPSTAPAVPSATAAAPAPAPAPRSAGAGASTSPGAATPRSKSADSSTGTSTGPGRATVDDVLAAGAPAAAMGAPMMMPGMVNPAAYASRIGPQIPPHLLMPGTATSGAQATPMSEREFSSLLDRLKGDRPSTGSSTPTLPSGSGGGGGASAGGPAVAPRVVQPTSWVNASTSPTGVSEAQNSKTVSASPQSSSSATSRPGMMPPMGPMSPMGANGAGGPKDPKDQPHIKNADPDVYGDDVQTIDPIIDNKGGRFT